jgi:hypothetical protein
MPRPICFAMPSRFAKRSGRRAIDQNWLLRTFGLHFANVQMNDRTYQVDNFSPEVDIRPLQA